MNRYQLSLIAAITALLVNPIRSEVIVEIDQGTLRGYDRTDRDGGSFYAFRSIPYAKPPVGDLRFMPPAAHDGWNGILNATDDLPICFQGVGQEDCLYLSVFTKNIESIEVKPVMVFFHGGGFVELSPQEDYYNPEHLLTKDIVLVTAGYRLGFLGFLNLRLANNHFLTANSGLKDQVAVLQWVQKNINKFGGDKNSVTIFGESAGASSVHLHMLSPLSRGLFHRGIAESGSALVTWTIGKPGSGEALAQALNITTVNSDDVLKELQQIDSLTIYEVQVQIVGNGDVNQAIFTSPIVEGNAPGAFITAHPKEHLLSGNYAHVPLIIGYNSMEGIYLDVINKLTGGWMHLYNLKYTTPSDLRLEDEETIQKVVKEMEDFYFDGRKPVPEDDALILIDVITDTWFMYGIVKAAELHAAHGDTIFLYEFNGDTKLNFFKRMHSVTAQYNGASHMDELGYLFKNVASPPVEPNSIEDRMIDKMVDMWVNFAYFDNPTPSGSTTQWAPASINNRSINYFDISNDNFSNSVEPLKERVEFWNRIYQTYGPKMNE